MMWNCGKQVIVNIDEERVPGTCTQKMAILAFQVLDKLTALQSS